MEVKSHNEVSDSTMLAKLHWLVGYWKSEMFGGIAEEIWAEPSDGSMLGMFKLVKDGAVYFYEIITITEANGTLTMRIRHFDPELNAWEGPNAALVWELVELGADFCAFSGITYKRIDNNNLNVELRIRQNDSTVKTSFFQFKRHGRL